MNAARRCISLTKGRQRFVFRYAEGRESELLAALVALADDPDSEFDWFDAAVLSYQLGHRRAEEFDSIAQVE